jgi:periplasmic protein TonB
MRQPSPLPDVFTAREIARAGRVPAATVEALLLSGQMRTIDGTHVAYDEALRVLRALTMGVPVDVPEPAPPAALQLALPSTGKRDAALPIAISSSVHGTLLGALMLIAMAGVGETRSEPQRMEDLTPARMVFLARPGPGGGGGGGGLKQPKPAARAERKGDRSLSSPLPKREPPPPVAPEPEPPPPEPEVKPEPLPPVEAPVAVVASDPRDRPGVVEDVKPPTTDSRGQGEGGGAGTGTGTGLGEGRGTGIGEGEDAGTGGGPYRPGSDINPPSLLREVKPSYTEEARRRGIEGEVVLEIVVRSNGSVGDVRVLQGLGSGLDQRAIEAVRQWRFSAATRKGRPVDVLVEVAVDFRLR